MFALTEIKGVGRRYANVVCKKADVDLNKRYGDPPCPPSPPHPARLDSRPASLRTGRAPRPGVVAGGGAVARARAPSEGQNSTRGAGRSTARGSGMRRLGRGRGTQARADRRGRGADEPTAPTVLESSTPTSSSVSSPSSRTPPSSRSPTGSSTGRRYACSPIPPPSIERGR